MSEWIPVTERLPEPDEDYGPFTYSVVVLATDGVGCHCAFYQRYEDEEFEPSWILTGPDGYELGGVTHWMPLPEPPKP